MKILIIVIVIVILNSVLKANTLKLHNLHTNEKIELKFENDKIKNKKEINYFLRDFRTKEITNIDDKLLKNLYKIIKLNNLEKKEIKIISGYRSFNTNKNLNKKFKNTVAKRSLHMKGRAIDFYIENINLKNLYERIKKMNLGGVGYYKIDNFIHLDTGDIKFWKIIK